MGIGQVVLALDALECHEVANSLVSLVMTSASNRSGPGATRINSLGQRV